MRLSEILREDTIKVPLAGREKYEIIEELVDLLARTDKIRDREQVLQAVCDREAVMSTGVGDGVAIPHGKSEGAPNIVVALGIAENPVDFEAVDDKPVSLVWLLVGPPGKTGSHLKALSRISRLMHNEQLRQELSAARSPDEAMETLLREEENLIPV